MLQSKKSQMELAAEVRSDPHLHKMLLKVVSNQDYTKIDAESRDSDPDWFEGLLTY